MIFLFLYIADREETYNILTFKYRLNAMFSEEFATESTRSDKSPKKVYLHIINTMEDMEKLFFRLLKTLRSTACF